MQIDSNTGGILYMLLLFVFCGVPLLIVYAAFKFIAKKIDKKRPSG